MDKYLEWKNLSDQLRLLKAAEMNVRKTLCMELFNGETGKIKKELETESGYLVVAKGAISYRLDDSLVNQMFDELNDFEKNALKFKPSLRMREYNSLPKDSILHDAVVVSPAAPTLTVTKL